jgi:hypothetical protein
LHRFVNLERYWRPALAMAHIPDFRFHDLRHTFASRLTMAGVDLYQSSGQAAGSPKSWSSDTPISTLTTCERPSSDWRQWSEQLSRTSVTRIVTGRMPAYV